MSEIIVKAAMSVARDAAEGQVSTSDLERTIAEECRALFGVVRGPDDPLWALHAEVARQVLSQSGVPIDELAEWLAVARRRAEETTESPTL